MTAKIVTFYSFKGGVGRSLCLAHIAWILASNDKKVLVVDWDLESPGLHKYFEPVLRSDGPGQVTPVHLRDGLLDIMASYLADRRLPPQKSAVDYCYSMRTAGLISGSLSILPAGRQDEQYADRLDQVDWKKFQDDKGWSFLENLLEDLRKNFDCILIDSRTGYSDTSGACLHLFPDTVVICFAMNNQSIDGARDVALAIRSRKPDVKILPVPTRVDVSGSTRLTPSRIYYGEVFRGIATRLMHHDIDIVAYLDRVEIPYAPELAFEENLPQPRGDEILDPDPTRLVTARCETLAAYIVGLDPDGVRLRINDLPEWARLSGGAARGRRPISDIVVSYASSDRRWANWIIWNLEKIGFRVTRHNSSQNPGELLGDVHRESAGKMCVVALLSQAYENSTSSAMTWEWIEEKEGPLSRTEALVPVRIAPHVPSRFFSRPSAVNLQWQDRSVALQYLLNALGQPVERSARASIVLEPAFPGEDGIRANLSRDRDESTGMERMEFAYDLLQSENYRGAVRILQPLVDKAGIPGDNFTRTRAFLGLGYANLNLGNLQAAAASFREATDADAYAADMDFLWQITEVLDTLLAGDGESGRGTNDIQPGTRAELTLAGATVARHLGRPNEANNLYLNSRRIFIGHGSRGQRGTARCDLGLGLVAMGETNGPEYSLVDFVDAERYFWSAVRDAGEDHATRFAALVGIGDTKMESTARRRHYEEALKIADGEDQKIVANVRLGRLEKAIGNHDAACERFTAAVVAAGGAVRTSRNLLEALRETRPASPTVPDNEPYGGPRLSQEVIAAENVSIRRSLELISLLLSLGDNVAAADERHGLADQFAGRSDTWNTVIERQLRNTELPRLPNEQLVREFVGRRFGSR